jgi:hypothetical protein
MRRLEICSKCRTHLNCQPLWAPVSSPYGRSVLARDSVAARLDGFSRNRVQAYSYVQAQLELAPRYRTSGP